MRHLFKISTVACFAILIVIAAGCIGQAWDDYQQSIDAAIADLEAGKISKEEFNTIRETEAKEFQEAAKAEIKEQTRGPITGNPLIDSLIGAAGVTLAGMYEVNRRRNRNRKDRGEPVAVPDK